MLFFCSRTESKRSKNDVSSRTKSRERRHAETHGHDIKPVRASTTSSRRIAPLVGLLLLVFYW